MLSKPRSTGNEPDQGDAVLLARLLLVEAADRKAEWPYIASVLANRIKGNYGKLGRSIRAQLVGWFGGDSAASAKELIAGYPAGHRASIHSVNWDAALIFAMANYQNVAAGNALVDIGARNSYVHLNGMLPPEKRPQRPDKFQIVETDTIYGQRWLPLWVANSKTPLKVGPDKRLWIV